MKRAFAVLPMIIFLAAAFLGAGQAPAGADRLTAEFFKGFELRTLGPSLMTGRVADIEVDPRNPNVYYVATGAGGLWKSENRGITFTPIFDDGGSFSLACIVIDPRNSNVLWLGTGENSNPRASMVGDGVYKSSDAGKAWARAGLERSEHIGNIKIDPRNSDVVYVAAQGPLWSSGGDRGVYKTTDGGKTWKAVLTVSADTGANEVIIDPNNPDVLYASTWQRRRGVGQFIGGGPESAIYKSTNGGATWTKLAGGLPKGDMGRIALGVDPKAKPTRVYALCNAKREESGFYRSDDAGTSWTRFGHFIGGGRGGGGGDRTNWDCPYIISPHSTTRLYWGSYRLYRSEDRGDHWVTISGDLTRNLDPTTIPIMGKVWPTDSVSYNQATTRLSTIVSIDESPLVEGLLYVGTDDGLLQVSEDGGKNWRKVDKFPGVPDGTYVSDAFASPRDADVVFVALNNWQKGDYKPYLLKSTDRGQTFTSIAGDLPDRHDVWSVVQDHINGNLMFAGTEFGLFFTVDGGRHWVQLKGGLPVCQVRDLAIQKRENDLALGTFGGFGGRGGAPPLDPGRYTATLGKMTGDTVTPIGKPQSFMVVPLPAKNY